MRLLRAIGIALVVFDRAPNAWTLAGGALIAASGIYVSGVGARAR